MRYDYVVIGGGIIGLATAWRLQQQLPGKQVLLLEKEDAPGRHQTGHNSGVIHAGVYYTPGSLKARLCQQGALATMEFCRANNIHFEQCGKLLVATNQMEYRRLLALAERCKSNDIDFELLDANMLMQREPRISGVAAILVPASGIVDYALIAGAMAKSLVAAGGDIKLRHEVIGLFESEDKVLVEIKNHTGHCNLDAGFVIACAGLAADRLTRMMNLSTDFRILPFRGEYYQLSDRCKRFVRHLIYPVPDPDLPFLGIHLTPMINGSITVGPNAVLGFKREGYGRFNFSGRDSWEIVGFSGFWKLAYRHWKSALDEFTNAWGKMHYLSQVQKYCPDIQVSDLQTYPAGIRAQAVRSDGSLVQDFLFADSPRSLHVCNAPSPGATSAIPIGDYIRQRVLEKARARATGIAS